MKNNLNILNHFQHNKLAIVLPSIDTENTYNLPNDKNQNPGFRESFTDIISNLSTAKDFSYNLALSLFLHTNDNSKVHHPGILPGSGLEDEEEIKSNLWNLMAVYTMFYSRYRNHGYAVLYQSTVDFRKNKIDPYSYAIAVTRALGSEIICTNEGLADEFIDFKKPALLTITRKPHAKS